MAAIPLRITSPQHGLCLVGNPAVVTLRGEAASLPEHAGIPLYFRWFSETLGQEGVGPLVDPSVPVAQLFPLGSHAIVLAVSDQPGADDVAYRQVKLGGVTGGRSGREACVIHVVHARILEPVDPPPPLPPPLHWFVGSTVTLRAVAPPHWVPDDTGPPPPRWTDESYLQINALQYSWSLRVGATEYAIAIGAPARGRWPNADSEADPNTLSWQVPVPTLDLNPGNSTSADLLLRVSTPEATSQAEFGPILVKRNP